MLTPSTTTPPLKSREEIATRLTEISSILARERALGQKLSSFRLLSFLAFATGVAWALSDPAWPLLWLALPALSVFIGSFLWHGKVLDRIDHFSTEEALLGERRERITARKRSRPSLLSASPPGVAGAGPTVVEDAPGSYFELEAGVVDDLDLVKGARSLLGFLDATSTIFGARRLLEMVRRPLLSIPQIKNRQEAISSAAARPSLVDGLLEALFPLRKHRLEDVPRVLSDAPTFAGRVAIRLWAFLAGAAAPTLLVLTFIDRAYAPYFFLSLIANMAVIGLYMKRTNRVRDGLLMLMPLLDALAKMRSRVASERPAGAAWTEALAVLEELREPGRRLRRRIRRLEIHDMGPLFEALNVMTLWELQLLPPAEKLMVKHRLGLERAVARLGEIEALLSLALPLFEQPGFSIPEPVESSTPLLSMAGLGHPLIEPDRVVLNDLHLDAQCPIAIITGSNMSGKSTLLKSVGMNLVLAGMGGPVEARTMRWTPLGLSSDINVRDSLDDGKSYFAVEVERVERIIRLAEEDGKVLGIFDELFRGTNSAERLAIAMALIAHLRAAGGLYLVATHDLAITRLEKEIPGITNFHFREEVREGVMRFDYRLRPGPAPTRNAILVLESRGYPPSLVREAHERLRTIEGLTP